MQNDYSHINFFWVYTRKHQQYISLCCVLLGVKHSYILLFPQLELTKEKRATIRELKKGKWNARILEVEDYALRVETEQMMQSNFTHVWLWELCALTWHRSLQTHVKKDVCMRKKISPHYRIVHGTHLPPLIWRSINSTLALLRALGSCVLLHALTFLPIRQRIEVTLSCLWSSKMVLSNSVM